MSDNERGGLGWWLAPLSIFWERANTAIAEANYQVQEQRRAQADLQESANYIGRQPGYSHDVVYNLDGDDPLYDLIKKSRIAYYRYPWIKGAVDNFVNYAVGDGFNFEPDTEDEKARDYWESFEDASLSLEVQQEMVRRWKRDGEFILRWFPPNRSRGETLPEFRFVDPIRVRDPRGQISMGVMTEPDDISKPVAYYIKPTEESMDAEVVPADQILHFKAGVDSDQKRGRPWTEIALAPAEMSRQWINGRAILNRARSAYAVVKKVDGKPSEVLSISDGQNQTNNASGSTKASKAMRPGSRVTTSKNVDIEFPSANLNASDTQHDGRAIALMMAAGLNMPEFMVTGDASNANYASTFEAAGPSVKMFNASQAALGCWLGLVLAPRVFKDGQRIGAVSQSLDAMTVAVNGDSVEARDSEKHTRTILLQTDAGLMSDKTARGGLGLDNDEEEAELEAQVARDPDVRIRQDAADNEEE